MNIALQVFLGLALFAVVLGVLVVVRRWQVSAWHRVRPALGPTIVVTLAALVGCALAAAAGWAIASAMA